MVRSTSFRGWSRVGITRELELREVQFNEAGDPVGVERLGIALGTGSRL